MHEEFRVYDMLLMLKGNLTDEQIDNTVTDYKEFLLEKGCQVVAKNLGKTSLAYQVKNFENAVKIQFFYLGNGEVTKSLNIKIQRDDAVLKSTIIKFNKVEELQLSA